MIKSLDQNLKKKICMSIYFSEKHQINKPYLLQSYLIALMIFPKVHCYGLENSQNFILFKKLIYSFLLEIILSILHSITYHKPHFLFSSLFGNWIFYMISFKPFCKWPSVAFLLHCCWLTRNLHWYFCLI